jgi:hypothetical protein
LGESTSWADLPTADVRAGTRIALHRHVFQIALVTPRWPTVASPYEGIVSGRAILALLDVVHSSLVLATGRSARNARNATVTAAIPDCFASRSEHLDRRLGSVLPFVRCGAAWPVRTAACAIS